MADCGHRCYEIGGPWIAEDPDCPIHGHGMVDERDATIANLRAEVERLTRERERQERDVERLISERDAASDAFVRLAGAVGGRVSVDGAIEDANAARAEVERLTRERDAYKRLTDRYETMGDTARAALGRAEAEIARLNVSDDVRDTIVPTFPELDLTLSARASVQWLVDRCARAEAVCEAAKLMYAERPHASFEAWVRLGQALAGKGG